jgi:tol-pal system protein YbgF
MIPFLHALAVAVFAAASFVPAMAQEVDVSDLVVRMERMENQLRQMTGTIEQLQFRNQQLEQQLRAMQGGGAGAGAPAQLPPPGRSMQSAPPPVQTPVAPPTPGRRGEAFDPAQQPNAPGVPRALGGGPSPVTGPVATNQDIVDNPPPVGAPGGREAGAPLDLNTMSRTGAPPPPPGSNVPFNTAPPPAANNQASNNPAMASTAPPGNTPKDEYDLAYGYVLRKDYALAETGFRDFLRKYPNDAMTADAQYWLGETLYQRQRYQDAADSFLVVIRNHDKSGKAPDSLLRLGQSLAAIGQKEMACASLNEVSRKYPRASSSVKRGVETEQKRAKC